MSISLAGACAGENYRLVRRKYYWVSLLLTAAVGFLGSIAPRVEEAVNSVQNSLAGTARVNTAASAFFYFSTGAKGAAIVAALLTTLAASSAVAGESQSGTLRLLLCRSIEKRTLFTSKFLSLFSFLTTLLLLGFAAAAVAASIVGDFDAIVVVIEKSTLGEMASRTFFACLVSTLGALGILGMALLASVLARASATATAFSIGFLLISALLASALDSARPYLFPTFTTRPFDTLQDFALGIDAPRPIWFGMPSLQDWADVSFSLLVPGISAAVLTFVGARIFSRRDWLS